MPRRSFFIPALEKILIPFRLHPRVSFSGSKKTMLRRSNLDEDALSRFFHNKFRKL